MEEALDLSFDRLLMMMMMMIGASSELPTSTLDTIISNKKARYADKQIQIKK